VGSVLHALRNRLQLAVHLGAQLPLLVRGLYQDSGGRPIKRASKGGRKTFLEQFFQGLSGIRPVNVQAATQAVLRVLNHHVDPYQIEKVRQARPESIRALWPASGTMGPRRTGGLCAGSRSARFHARATQGLRK
jgi:uncharacterized protein (DUF2267 family)